MKTLLILMLIGACARLGRGPVLSESAQEFPGWVWTPYEGCVQEDELCATGEGKNFSSADAQAKVNLASIFEVKVQSEFNANTNSSQTFPWQSDVRQEVQQSLKENVDQVLEVVQIKKHFKKDNLSYALASLDRQKASELLGARLTILDKELEQLWSRRQRLAMRKIFALNLEREKLGERYSIVSGSPKPSKVKYEDVLAWKDSRSAPVPLTLKIGQAPEWLSDKLKEILTEGGFKLSRGEGPILLMNVDSLREYLNVEGFEKYTFTLKLTAEESGEKQRVISTSETVTGRSQADALLKVKTKFIIYLEQHLADLHLD